MADNKTCPHCGKPVPPTALGDLCPECMLKAGLATQTEGPGASGEATGPRFVPPPVGEIAKLFPQLEILRLIGQGGMGAVYKARQPALDRFVALKVLPPAAAGDPGFAERFNREARALARLNHPNIVAVHDFGKAGTLHYLVMEFVDGANLREVERVGELTPEQALAIVPQICEALQFAHNEGIVHRDIKPENLLLDKRGRVKITDFGIAKMVGAGAGPQNLTGAKDVVGTPHYMAPEQIEKPLSVDHRADIYSLGVVFYEMLTGELPLGKFQPPSKKVQIDVRLDDVVLHALEKEPNRRYQQASQVKSAVETIVTTPGGTGPANQNEPAPTAAQIEAARQRLKFPARGLIASGLLLVLFALGLLVFAMPAIAREGGGLAGYAAVSFGSAVFVLFATVVFLGAHSMTKLRNHSLSIAASVVAAFAGPGALLGLPFGIWACLELVRPEVRAAFAATRQREGKAVLTSSETEHQRPPAAAALRHGSRVGFLLFLLIAGAAAIITLLMQKDYVATATVRLTGPEPTDPYHLQTETEIIQSQPVLEPVAASLNLSQRWGQKFNGGAALSDDQTVAFMKPRVDVRPIRNTALVEIRFHSDSAAEAAEVANKIAATYCARPPGHAGEIIDPAVAPWSPDRPKILLNLFLGMIAGGIFGIFVGTGVGLISFWRMRTASPPNLQQPDRFWRHFAVSIAVVLLTLILVPALLVLLAMFAPAFNRFQSRMDSAHSGNALRQNAETNFFMGQAWFPQGDSIEIASVERTPERMVVKGRYNLISHDQALLALYITTSTNIPVPEDASQRMEISKGSGEFELIHPHLVPGLPHVSMYADGHPFASYYFGNADEALEEGKATWISAADKSSLEVAQKGWQLLKAGKLDEAVAKFRQAVQIAPDEANAWNGLGWAEFTSGNAQAAESAFQKTVSLDPNHPGGLNGLGQIYLSQRNYAQAEVYLQKAAPQASAAWYGLARLYLLEGKYGQAEKWAQDLVDAGQADELVHQMLKAAQEKHLSDGLRFRIEPAATSTPGPSPTTNARQPSALQFRLVLPDNSTAPADWLPSASGSNRFRLSRQVLLDDTAIARAGVDFDPSGRRMIEIRFTDTGAHQFEAITATNIGHQLAIVFRGRVLSAPVIQSVIPGGGCQVDASMNAGEVNEIVDRLNRVAIPAPEAWGFSPVEERVLSLKPRPDALFGWLDLDSGTTLASALLDWESRTGYEWIRTNGFDVVTVESAKHFPTLLGFDMVIAPAPTNGWDIVTPADVANNWTLRQAEPRQKQVFSAMPGRTDSFIFQTREGGRGILQFLGFAGNPPGVKVRYKLVQASRPSEAIDSATGLPVTPGQTGAIDSATGLPATRPASN